MRLQQAETLLTRDVEEDNYPLMHASAQNLIKELSLCLDLLGKSHSDLFLLVGLPLVYDIHDEYYWAALNLVLAQKVEKLPWENKVQLLKLLQAFQVQKKPVLQYSLLEVYKAMIKDPSINDPQAIMHKVSAICHFYAEDPASGEKGEDAVVAGLALLPCELMMQVFTELLSIGTSLPPKILRACDDWLIVNMPKIPDQHYGLVLDFFKRLGTTKSAGTTVAFADCIINKLPTYTVSEVVQQLLRCAKAELNSIDLFLALEKRLELLMHKIAPHDVPLVLEAFSRSGNFRYQFFVHFHTKLKACIHKLTLDELAVVVESYTRALSRSSFVYNLCEQLLLAGKNKLSPQAILRVVYGYANPNITLSSKVHQELESIITYQLSHYPPSLLVRTLRIYQVARRGSKAFFEVALNRLLKDYRGLDRTGAMYLLALSLEYANSDNDLLAVKQAILIHNGKYTVKEKEDILRQVKQVPTFKDLPQLLTDTARSP